MTFSAYWRYWNGDKDEIKRQDEKYMEDIERHMLLGYLCWRVWDIGCLDEEFVEKQTCPELQGLLISHFQREISQSIL